MVNMFKKLLEKKVVSADTSIPSSVVKSKSIEQVLDENEDYLNDGSNAYCGYSAFRKAEKKVKNAIKSYGDDYVHPSDVLFLLDDTLMGSAKDGFFITSTKIYLKEAYEKPVSFYWSDIERVSLRGKDLRINSKTISFTHSEHQKYLKRAVSCIEESLGF